MSRHCHQDLDERKRKRIGQENSLEEDIAWTTARCSRLLRTINSRIEAIRQLIRPDCRASKPVARPLAKISKRKPESLTDPAWLPNGAKKSHTRTYAARSRPKVSRAVRSDECSRPGQVNKITLPSPFLKRVQHFGTEHVPTSPAPSRISHNQLRQRKPERLPVKMYDPTEKAEVALRTAFQAFLSITRKPGPDSKRGARSLLGTCLRQVPQYLESQIIALDDDEGDTRESCANEVWSFFEDLLEIKGSGWQGLREVVRSQGIHAVRCAIFDDSLSDGCIEALVNYCLGFGALPEAEMLLGQWLERSCIPTLAKICTLDSIAVKHGAEGMRFRVLTNFVKQDSSRIVALANADKDIWNKLLRAITQGAQVEALDFLQVCLDSHMLNYYMPQKPDARAEQLLTNLDEIASKLCIMSSTSLLLEETSTHGAQLQEAQCRLAMSLLLGNRSAVTRLSGPWVLGPVVLTALIGGSHFVTTTSNALSETYDHLARNPFHRRAAGKREQDFAVSIAADLFSLHSDEGLGIIDAVLVRIRQHIERSQGTTTTTILRHIATEILTRRRLQDDCSHAGDEDDHTSQYMARKESTARMSGVFQTPRAKAARYGWDADLCEWIARTPFTRDRSPHRSWLSPGFHAAMVEKENEEPETPDVLVRSMVKIIGKREVSVEPPSPQRPVRAHSRPGSPQVVIARAVKRRKSNRLESRRVEEDSEDELAI